MDFPHKGLIWINNEKKIGYLHISKCASTSIRTSANLSRDYFLKWDSRKKKQFFKFTVIRNPYQRFLSGYSEALERRDIPCNLFDKMNDENFEKVIKMLEENKYVDTHVTPQIEYICNLKIDKFIKFENLVNELNNLAEEINFQNLKNIQHLQQTNRKYEVEYFVEKFGYKDKIDKIYEKDWELYNKLFN